MWIDMKIMVIDLLDGEIKWIKYKKYININEITNYLKNEINKDY